MNTLSSSRSNGRNVEYRASAPSDVQMIQQLGA
jgi:hypothetical protein